MIRPIVFGKFCLLERISVGGMAEIYRAKLLNAPHFKRFMAVKRVLPSLVADNEFITMFIDEAKISVELNHPNICQVYELGRLNDAHYMVMEFISGHDLLSIQKYYRSQRKIMSVSQSCFIIAQVAQGLDFAHRATDRQGQPLGIVHRDISPQNVLISYDGVVKLIDFGVAKAASKNSKTQAGVLKGKFGYMSPEQADASQTIDNRSDLFGLGTVFWELLTGRRLFYDENDYVTLEKVRVCAVAPPSTYNHLVPPQVDAIVMKALQREARDRYATGGQMAQDLWAFISSGNPPYTQGHLQHWMCTAFAENLTKEWENIAVFETLNTAQEVQRYNAEHNWSDQEGEAVDFEGNIVPALTNTDGKPESTQVFTPQFDYNKIKGDAVDSLPKQGGDAPAGLNNPMHMSQFEMAALSLKSNKKGPLIAVIAVAAVVIIGLGVAAVLILGAEEDPAPPTNNTPTTPDAASPATESKYKLAVALKTGNGEPAEAELYMGDALVGQGSGLKVTFDNLKPATYRVLATHPRFQDAELTHTITDADADLTLEIKTKKAASARFKVSPEAAQISLNAIPTATGIESAKGLPLELGKTYEVEIKHLGYRAKRLTIKTDQPGEQVLPDVTLAPGVGSLSLTLNKKADIVLRSSQSGEERKFENTDNVVIPGLDASLRYQLTVTRSGYKPWSEDIQGFDETLNFQLSRQIELVKD